MSKTRKVTVQSLQPGFRYYVQARVRSGDSKSEWSDFITVDIPKDSAAPSPPTGLSVDFTGPSMIIQWDGTQSVLARDFLDFEVSITLDSNVQRFYTTDTSFELTLEENELLFGKTPTFTSVSVRARDSSKNTSTATTVLSPQNQPPSAPSGSLTATGGPQSYLINLGNLSGRPKDYFATKVSVYSALTGGTMVHSWTGTDSVATIQTTNYDQRFVTARYIDAFGQEGQELSPRQAVTAVNPVIVDTVAPDIPTAGFSTTSAVDSADVTGQSVQITANWTGVNSSDLSGYKLKFSKINDSSAAGTVIDVPSAPGLVPKSASFSGVADQTYYWWVASYDNLNNVSAWSATQSHKASKDSSPPTAPTGVTFSPRPSPEINSLAISWTSSPNLSDFQPSVGIGYYEVQIASNELFTENVQAGRSQSTSISFSVPLWNTTYSARVRAVDTSGNSSAWTATVSQAIGTNPALSLANDKNTIFYNISTSIPSALKVGDLWLVSDLGYRLRRATSVGTSGWEDADLDSQAFKTNSIIASKIAAGAVTSDKIESNFVLVGKNLRVGDDPNNQINLIAGSSGTPGLIYSHIEGGIGTFADPKTGFYLDGTGKFSLADKLSFNGTTLSVVGEINASGGSFSGYVSADGMRFGKGVSGGGTNDGIYIDDNNYWYDSGYFRIGSQNNRVSWDGLTLSVSGAVDIRSGTVGGNIYVGGSVLATRSAGITSFSRNSSGIVTATLDSSSQIFLVGDSIKVFGLPSDANPLNGDFVVTDASSSAPWTVSYSSGGGAISSTVPDEQSKIFSVGLNNAVTLNSAGLVGKRDGNTIFHLSNLGASTVGGWEIDSNRLYAKSADARTFDATLLPPPGIQSGGLGPSGVLFSIWPWLYNQKMTITSTPAPTLYPGESITFTHLSNSYTYDVLERVGTTNEYLVFLKNSPLMDDSVPTGSISSMSVTSNFHGLSSQEQNNIVLGSTSNSLSDGSLTIDGSGVSLGESRLIGAKYSRFNSDYRSVFINSDVFGLNGQDSGSIVMSTEVVQGGGQARLDVFADSPARVALHIKRASGIVYLSFAVDPTEPGDKVYHVFEPPVPPAVFGSIIKISKVPGTTNPVFTENETIGYIGGVGNDYISLTGLPAGPDFEWTPTYLLVDLAGNSPSVSTIALSNRVPDQSISISNEKMTAKNFVGDLLEIDAKGLVNNGLTVIREGTLQAYSCIVKVNNQSVPNDTNTFFFFNVEESDPHEWHSQTTNTQRVTPTIPGLYHVTAYYSVDANVTGGRLVAIRKNGTAFVNDWEQGNGLLPAQMNLSSYVFMNGTTDYIDTTLLQLSGGNLNATCRMTVTLVGNQ